MAGNGTLVMPLAFKPRTPCVDAGVGMVWDAASRGFDGGRASLTPLDPGADHALGFCKRLERVLPDARLLHPGETRAEPLPNRALVPFI